MAAGGHLEFWWLDWPKCKIDTRNGFSMSQLVGKVVLQSFRCQFVFKLHFQYGRPRLFWILASHKFRRHFLEVHGGSIVFKYFKELKSSVKPCYALSGHGTPRLHPTNYPSIRAINFWDILLQSDLKLNQGNGCWKVDLTDTVIPHPRQNQFVFEYFQNLQRPGVIKLI